MPRPAATRLECLAVHWTGITGSLGTSYHRWRDARDDEPPDVSAAQRRADLDVMMASPLGGGVDQGVVHRDQLRRSRRVDRMCHQQRGGRWPRGVALQCRSQHGARSVVAVDLVPSAGRIQHRMSVTATPRINRRSGLSI